MPVREFDPAQGQAFQGDVAIIPVPANIRLDTSDEIVPREGRLILQEGELTGHHHAIDFDATRATNSPRLRAAFGVKTLPGKARLFRDDNVASAMVTAGILTRPDLAVGVLVVTGGPVVLVHEEHDGIRLPEGRYLVGRQVESIGADERWVAD